MQMCICEKRLIIFRSSFIQKVTYFTYLNHINRICTGGGHICPPLSYFNIAPKLNKSFALMHPDFESNLITHIFRKFGVSRTAERDVIFAFVRGI